MEKCCRYCKHYFSGYCENETVLRQLQVEDAIYAVAESGKLAEVLYEAELPWDPIEDEEKIAALEGAIGRAVRKHGIQADPCDSARGGIFL